MVLIWLKPGTATVANLIDVPEAGHGFNVPFAVNAQAASAAEGQTQMLGRLYPILDIAGIETRSSELDVGAIARCFFHAGIGFLQIRAKGASFQQVLTYASALTNAGHPEGILLEVTSPTRSPLCTLILNDRPDIALLSNFDGCHLGQDDLSIEGARRILPRPKILGLSTHNAAQVEAGNESDADYLAIGPVFATKSKANAEAVVGLAEFARLRKLTSKPVVAIGGITRDNARAVLDAGADSVAMIGDLYLGCTSANLTDQLERNLADILARIL